MKTQVLINRISNLQEYLSRKFESYSNNVNAVVTAHDYIRLEIEKHDEASKRYNDALGRLANHLNEIEEIIESDLVEVSEIISR